MTRDEPLPEPGELPVHRIGADDFDALAGGAGDARTMRLLRHAERSRRLLLLRAITDVVAKRPDLNGPLQPLDDAWELLARVQKTAPAALESILDHPYTG